MFSFLQVLSQWTQGLRLNQEVTNSATIYTGIVSTYNNILTAYLWILINSNNEFLFPVPRGLAIPSFLLPNGHETAATLLQTLMIPAGGLSDFKLCSISLRTLRKTFVCRGI